MDIKRAKQEATDQALKLALYMMLWVLVNNHNATKEELDIFKAEINDLADSINRGYVDWRDIAGTLEEEYEVELILT